ncbi:hypothetical protein HZH66_000366 [Vespula vulgaris]|uniref:Uncharacterized protein n=1 Tax=Vespula vulgaris TaxID=7454 RepID=A0A834NJP4_VESVU|nr:hypothetical protein HZH66_000366 [Vespula vulgaris]
MEEEKKDESSVFEIGVTVRPWKHPSRASFYGEKSSQKEEDEEEEEEEEEEVKEEEEEEDKEEDEDEDEEEEEHATHSRVSILGSLLFLAIFIFNLDIR